MGDTDIAILLTGRVEEVAEEVLGLERLGCFFGNAFAEDTSSAGIESTATATTH
jgi:hypothetical protein